MVRQAQDLLRDLGYERPGATGPDDETLHRARLLEAAAQFVRIFELGAPEAPGLFCFGLPIQVRQHGCGRGTDGIDAVRDDQNMFA